MLDCFFIIFIQSFIFTLPFLSQQSILSQQSDEPFFISLHMTIHSFGLICLQQFIPSESGLAAKVVPPKDITAIKVSKAKVSKAVFFFIKIPPLFIRNNLFKVFEIVTNLNYFSDSFLEFFLYYLLHCISLEINCVQFLRGLKFIYFVIKNTNINN